MGKLDLKPLYERAKELVSKDDASYRYKVMDYRGHKYEFFDYLIPSYNKFKEDNSFFMRGFCVIDESIVSPSLHKFFNYGEHAEWSDLNFNSPDVGMTIKWDGSLLIPFIIDGEVKFRTKMDLGTPLTDLAENLAKEKGIEEWIKLMIYSGKYPLYELTSPYFEIVVKYPKDDLNYLGHYNFEECSESVFECATNFIINDLKSVNVFMKENSIENIEEYLSKVENFEGFIFKDIKTRKIYKMKADEYITLHRLKSKEDNNILSVKMVVEETIDDFLPKVKHNQEIYDRLLNIKELVGNDFNSSFSECLKILEQDKDLDRKSFAVKNKEHRFFSFLINSYLGKRNPDLDFFKESFYLRTTRTKTECREYLKSIGVY